MTQRSNHSQTTTTRPHGQATTLHAVNASKVSLFVLTRLVPLSAALILVLVLITGHSSAEYGFA
jgi:hypothetical protein